MFLIVIFVKQTHYEKKLYNIYIHDICLRTACMPHYTKDVLLISTACLGGHVDKGMGKCVSGQAGALVCKAGRQSRTSY